MPRCALLPAGGQGRRASSHRKGKALSETRERIRDGIACATRLRNKRCRTVAQWSAGDFVGPSALLRSAPVARVMFAGGISPLSLACTHRTELTEPLLRTFILNARLAQVSNQLKTTARMARLYGWARRQRTRAARQESAIQPLLDFFLVPYPAKLRMWQRAPMVCGFSWTSEQHCLLWNCQFIHGRG